MFRLVNRRFKQNVCSCVHRKFSEEVSKGSIIAKVANHSSFRKYSGPLIVLEVTAILAIFAVVMLDTKNLIQDTFDSTYYGSSKAEGVAVVVSE